MLKFNKEWIDQFKENTGLTVIPTHDYKLLKQVRHELFEKDYKKYSDFYDNTNKNEFYHEWLKDEIEIVNKWIGEPSKDLQVRIEIDKYKQFLDNEIKQNKPLPPQPIVKSPFSVLEWATIFYYADETKLLSESRLLKTRLEQFMSKHQVNTTPVNFNNSYYEAKRRINKKADYPINKLESIIPFLIENYKQAVTKVENDIIILEENKPDY